MPADDAAGSTSRDRRQRAIALDVLGEVATAVAARVPADATLARIFRNHPGFGARDRRFYGLVVFSHFRWLGWTSRLAPDDVARQVAWALTLDHAPEGDPTVAGWMAETGLDDGQRGRLASCDLNGKGRFLAEVMPGHAFSLADLLPDWTPAVLEPAHLDRFIVSCQARPPTWVRVDPVRLPDFLVLLAAQQVRFHADQRIAGAVALEPPFQLALLERAWGWSIQVQDIGSQAVAAVCGARPGESWWDACCGAGGKTLALSRQVGPDGAVLATDVRESVLANLRQRATAFRGANITTLALDSAATVPAGRIFDGVLVDAPCSGLGTWPRNPDARWRIAREDLAARAAAQERLLGNVAARVKPGGLLIYALCTLTREESFEVVARFCAAHPDFQREPFTDPLTGAECPGERMILPDEGPGDGMYVARLRRCG